MLESPTRQLKLPDYNTEPGEKTQQEMGLCCTAAAQKALGSPSPAGSHVPPEKQPLFYLPWFATCCCSMPPSSSSSPASLSPCLYVPLTHTCFYTYTHTQTDARPDTHSGYLDPAAEASGDTKDTTGPRSGPSSHPELILHSQSPGQSLIPPPPPTDGLKARSADVGLTRSLL